MEQNLVAEHGLAYGPGCDPRSDHKSAHFGDFLSISDEQLAVAAKAMGSVTRIRILRILLEREGCVTGDLVAEIPLAQSTISEHLRQLRQAGLIQGEVDGPRTSYCANRDFLQAVKQAITTLE